MDRRDFLKATLAATVLGGAVFRNELHAAAASPASAPQGKGRNAMKVLVLTGSPRENGNSNTLADRFIRGATEAGHEIMRFDSAFKDVKPCNGCNKCGMNGDCVFKDDFESIRSFLLGADVVAFATPMYYFGISAQLKTVIDRFYSISSRLHRPKRAVLMMTYANLAPSEAEPIKAHYEMLLRYLNWSDAGQIIAPGVWPVGAINQTQFPEQAYNLGKSI